MIPKERPETGGREGIINARDHYSLTASDPSPFPGTLPPHLLSLQATYPWKSGVKKNKKPLRTRGCLEASLGETSVQLPPPVPLPWLTIGHLADGDG